MEEGRLRRTSTQAGMNRLLMTTAIRRGARTSYGKVDGMQVLKSRERHLT
jgi:hypothetical protein